MAIDVQHGCEEAFGARRGRALARALQFGAILLLVAASAFVGGFLVFTDQVVTSRPPAEPQADAIVALTGGANRIEDAVDLLDSGSAERLLISGVNQSTSPSALAERMPKLASLMPAVDIGYEAHNTRGNAQETKAWVEENGFDSLIVVTSAYHMPRSLAELAKALPDVELVPYPVRPERMADWHSDAETFKLLITEYVKYLVARLV